MIDRFSVYAARVSRPMIGGPLFVGLLAMAWQMVCAAPLSAGPEVTLVVGERAPRLERFAASELADQLRRVYDARVTTATATGKTGGAVIVLGSPATNPALAPLAGTWPRLSAQGHLLRSVKLDGRPALVIGGGSPVATLWGAYELGYQIGIRYCLFGDLDPVAPRAFTIEGYDITLEPALALRTWRTINDFPIGPESWGLAEQQRVVRQLAKLKYNRILLSLYPWQPFVDFAFRGVRKQTGELWYGWKYPIDGDTAGRSAFGGGKLFENPDFAGKTAYVDRVAAAVTLAKGVIETARELGMSTALLMSPLEFPREFAAVLKDARTIRAPEPLAIGPAVGQATDDPLLIDLARTQIRAYLQTYPEVDALYLSLPEFPDWGDQAERAFERLDARTGVARVRTLAQLSEAARQRGTIASGDRGVQALRGNLAALDFLHTLLADETLLGSPAGHRVTPVLADVDPALYPVLDKVLPRGTETLHFVDYTARRVVAQRALLGQAQADRIRSSLILTLADDNVGVLPQAAHASLAALVEDLRAQAWQGFSTRYWIAGDLDLSAAYLSRASFDPRATPQQVCEALLDASCGEGVSQRVWKAFEMIERATTIIDQNDLGFSFPVPGMVMKHYASAEPVPGWWSEVRDLYLNAMNEMYRANTRGRDGGRAFTLYFARRYEFAFEYMNCIEAVREASLARAAKDRAAQVAKLEAAIESMHGALSAYAAVARSNSDRGVIAVLNEYGYRPLQAEVARLQSESDAR